MGADKQSIWLVWQLATTTSSQERDHMGAVMSRVRAGATVVQQLGLMNERLMTDMR